MKLGVIIETNEAEKAWNGVRFCNAALKKGYSVKLFLMSSGVEIPEITHDKYNVKMQINDFISNQGIILACGTCIKSRNQEGSEVCPISTMNDCLEMVEWSDKVVTF